MSGNCACEDECFQMCLQGANLGKALKTWLESLKWPPDAKESDASDWGMSWIEMAVSFYLATGRITGAGGKSKYAPYRSNEAMLLPGNRRTAALQGLCLRHLIQNLESARGQTFAKLLYTQVHIFDLIGILTAGCGCALSSKIAQLSSNIRICTGLHGYV